MHHPRRFNRIRPSGLLSRTAKIIIDARSPTLDCTVVDYSAGGACLELSQQTKLPERFDLLYSGSRKKCRRVWASGFRVGVAF
jgi:hypothetical protein